MRTLSIILFSSLFIYTICSSPPITKETGDALIKIGETLMNKVLDPQQIQNITTASFTITDNYENIYHMEREDALNFPSLIISPLVARVHRVCLYRGPKVYFNSPVIEIDIGEAFGSIISIFAGRARNGNFVVFGMDVSDSSDRTTRQCYKNDN